MSSSDNEQAVALSSQVAGSSAGSTNVAAKKPKLTIAVASRNGNGVCLRARPSVTVKQLADLYAERTKTPLSQVHLSYKKRFLADHETLEDIGVENNKIIEVHSVPVVEQYTTIEYLFCN